MKQPKNEQQEADNFVSQILDSYSRLVHRSEKKDITQFLQEEGYFDLRYIEGVGMCGLMRMAFTTGLMVNIDSSGYAYRYCYQQLADAREALKNWDGKDHPPGDWLKRKGCGELVNPKFADKFK